MRKHKIIICTTFCLSLLLTNAYAQRVDEEMPKQIGVIKSISNLKGWKKNDLGQWKPAFTGIPFGEQTLKFEVSKISYEGKEHICLVKFYKHYYFKGSVKITEYGASFWVIEEKNIDDLKLKQSDSSIQTKVYKNIIVSDVLGISKPITWNDVIRQMKKCFIDTYPNGIALSDLSFIKYRYDYKQNKAHFFIGSLGDYSKEDDEYIDFTNNEICTDKNKNNNLGCCYYEVSKSMFEICFNDLIK